jgi:hypothetical protein
MRLQLVRAGHMHRASALRCSLPVLNRWADGATRASIECLHAARCGERELLRGARLPSLPKSVRYWGRRVLMPLGFRPEPDLPESALIEALGLASGEIAVLDPTGVEAIPEDAFQPLTRAGVRLAAAERRR